MTFDPLNPFANGPFILPVNTTGQTSSLQIPFKYESQVVYNGPPVSATYGVIGVVVKNTANLGNTLDALNTSGDLVLTSTTQDPVTGNDVTTTITNPTDVLTILNWLQSGTPQTLAQLSTPTTALPKPPLIPIFTQAMETEANNHDIQRLLEVNYIVVANRILTNALSSLNTALNNTNNILNTLSTIQDLHNKLTVITPPALAFDYLAAHGGKVSSYQSAFQGAASAYFGPPIFPDFLWSSAGAIVTGMPGGGTFAAYANEMQTSRTQLGNYLATLYPQTPIINGAPDPNSLYAKAKTVYDNMPGTTGVPATFTAARAWARDKYNVSESNLSATGKAGVLQQQITFAITAGQSLNDSLKEKVRRYMFVFEEYYKSASAMLTKISELISKFAQGIRPS